MAWFGKYLNALIVIILTFSSTVTGSTHERQLLNDLLQNYNSLERPAEIHAHSLNVSVGITLMQILKVDAKTDTLQTVLWLYLAWNDFNLKWNPQKYGNLSKLRIPSSRIWAPDILAYNSAGEAFDPTIVTNALVKSDGTVINPRPGIFTTTCKMDLRFFPFDRQKCNIKFGSWASDGADLNIKLHSEDGGDLTSFVQNQEWELTGLPAVRDEVYYACCPEPYVSVTFTLNLRRRGEPYYIQATTYNALISVLIFLSFLAPPASYHKITLGISSFALSIWTFLAIQGPRPLVYESPLVMYFGYLILLSCFGLVFNVFTVYLFHKMSPMSDCARKVIAEKIPTSPLRFLCPFRKPSPRISKANVIQTDSDNVPNSNLKSPEESESRNEWTYLAFILDRCFFVLIFIILAVSNVVLYLIMTKIAA